MNNGGRGTQVYKSADVDVVNNTFYQNMRTPDVANIGSEVMAYDSRRVRFANNLIISRPGVLPITAGLTTPVSFDNNLTVGTRDPAKSSTDRHLANGTRVLQGATVDASGLTASNFTPLASGAAIDHGTTSYGTLTVDFAGNKRSSGSSPDAGAVERGAAAVANWPWNGQLSAPSGDAPAPTPEPEPTPEPAPPTEELLGTVGRLYSAAFLRAPDDVGLEYWLNVDASVIDIAYVFTISEEFSNRYGQLDNNGFIDRMYRNVLERQPDQEGYDYWTNLMDNGLTRAELLLYFSDSAEFRSN